VPTSVSIYCAALQLQESIEALLKELSAVGVQKQAALKELEEERRRNQQLEGLLEHKVSIFLLSPHSVFLIRSASYFLLLLALQPFDSIHFFPCPSAQVSILHLLTPRPCFDEEAWFRFKQEEV
jgi:hypothetical protein